jgi:hypothetical protein
VVDDIKAKVEKACPRMAHFDVSLELPGEKLAGISSDF